MTCSTCGGEIIQDVCMKCSAVHRPYHPVPTYNLNPVDDKELARADAIMARVYQPDEPSPPRPRRDFPVKSGVWRHYKGHHYLVIGEIRHTETNEVCVAHIPLYEHENGGIPLQARPKIMWNEDVLHEGQTVRRFVYVGAEVPKK